jgi:hypothetical protein
MAEIEAQFPWTAEFARRSFIAYAWRRYAGWFIGSLLVGGCCALGLMARDMRAAALLILGALIFWWFGWLRAYRSAGRIALSYAKAPVTLRANDEGLSLSSSRSRSMVAWSTITHLYRLPSAWVFVTSERSSTAVPAVALSAEARSSIEARIRQAGGQVR